VELTLEAVEAHAAHLTLVTTAREVEAAFAAGRIGVLLGVEGGQALGNSLEVLRGLHRLGVRLLTLTHTKHLAWASSCQGAPPHGMHPRCMMQIVRASSNTEPQHVNKG